MVNLTARQGLHSTYQLQTIADRAARCRRLAGKKSDAWDGEEQRAGRRRDAHGDLLEQQSEGQAAASLPRGKRAPVVHMLDRTHRAAAI